MLSLEDCLEFCDLEQDEVAAIAEHEHVPTIVAAELGCELLKSEAGVARLHTMILDDIQVAGALDGLVWATGHFRNGILLTPVTADLVAAALNGEPLPDWAAPADPLRFAGVAA